MNTRYSKYEPIFGSWYIRDKIGQGSTGEVLLIEKKDQGNFFRSALKCITIPQSEDELISVRSNGMSDKEVKSYYSSFLDRMRVEFTIMARMKGNSNVVSYEDHEIIPHENGFGWDILIRMELLTPLLKYCEKHPLDENDVIRLGIDMCKALELCNRNGIIHRDVKPENMFIAPSGDFKLGDFGISRMLEETKIGLSRKGTYLYMAPEVFKGEPYGARSDIYSLGLVLYKFLNGGRNVFMPDPDAPVLFEDSDRAFFRRMSGAMLPPPAEGSESLKEIVLRASSYIPKDRFDNAIEMRKALEKLSPERKPLKDLEFVTSGWYSSKLIDEKAESVNESRSIDSGENQTDEDLISQFSTEGLENNLTKVVLPKTKNVSEVSRASEMQMENAAADSRGSYSQTGTPGAQMANDSADDRESYASAGASGAQGASAFSETKKSKKSKRVKAFITGLVAIAAVVVLIIFIMLPKEITDVIGINDTETIYIGDTQGFKYDIEPDRFEDEAISFESSDPEVLTVDKSGSITGESVGDAVMTLSVMGFTKDIHVNVVPKVTDIKGIKSNLSLYEGKSSTLKPELVPEKFADEAISYKSSDKDIATVSKKGKIKAKKEGKATITISSGGCEEKVKITVKKKVAAKKPDTSQTTQNSGSYGTGSSGQGTGNYSSGYSSGSGSSGYSGSYSSGSSNKSSGSSSSKKSSKSSSKSGSSSNKKSKKKKSSSGYFDSGDDEYF